MTDTRERLMRRARPRRPTSTDGPRRHRKTLANAQRGRLGAFAIRMPSPLWRTVEFDHDAMNSRGVQCTYFRWLYREIIGQTVLFVFLTRHKPVTMLILARTPRLQRIVICGFLLSCAAGIVMSTGPAMVSSAFGLSNASFAHAQMHTAVATFVAMALKRRES